MYFDNTHPEECSNRAHGCGWVDAAGGTHPTTPFLGMRRLFMMVRQQFVKRGQTPFIMKHAGMFPGTIDRGLCRPGVLCREPEGLGQGVPARPNLHRHPSARLPRRLELADLVTGPRESGEGTVGAVAHGRRELPRPGVVTGRGDVEHLRPGRLRRGRRDRQQGDETEQRSR